MQLMEAKTEDFVKEKHVPYIEKQDGGFLVKVGKETAHPMADDHYIVYIEICADGVQMRKYLKPGDAPEAFFKTDAAQQARTLEVQPVRHPPTPNPLTSNRFTERSRPQYL